MSNAELSPQQITALGFGHDYGYSYKAQLIPQEAGNLSVWSKTEVTELDLLEVPASIVGEIYGAYFGSRDAFNSNYLRPKGKQWDAFRKLIKLVKSSKAPEDIEVAKQFVSSWRAYAHTIEMRGFFGRNYTIFGAQEACKTSLNQQFSDLGLAPIQPMLPDCYTVQVMQYEILRLNLSTWACLGRKSYDMSQNRKTLKHALLYSVSTLFTPWLDSVDSSQGGSAGSRTHTEKENVLAPFRGLAEHFLREDPKTFNELFSLSSN